MASPSASESTAVEVPPPSPTPPSHADEPLRAIEKLRAWDFSPLQAAAEQAARQWVVTPTEALEEFRRFLELRLVQHQLQQQKQQPPRRPSASNDWSTPLLPTQLMAYMWRAAILDTKFYDHLQAEIACKIHRDAPPTTTSSGQQQQPSPSAEELTPSSNSPLGLRYHERFGGELVFPQNRIVCAPPTMTIDVKSLTGVVDSFEVDPSDPVESIKYRVEARRGIPHTQQRLVFQGKIMAEGHRLAEYDVQPGSIIHLVLKLC